MTINIILCILYTIEYIIGKSLKICEVLNATVHRHLRHDILVYIYI